MGETRSVRFKEYCQYVFLFLRVFNGEERERTLKRSSRLEQSRGHTAEPLRICKPDESKNRLVRRRENRRGVGRSLA